MDNTPSPLSLPAHPRDRGVPRVFPNQFPLTGSELLRVTTANSLANVRVVVQGRQLGPDGKLVPFRRVTVPNTNRTVKTEDFPLGPGAIVNLVAYVEGATPVRGRTFVQVRLVLGEGADRPLLGTLVQGYITATQERAWPGSTIESSVEGPGWPYAFTGTVPAAGATIAETVPTGARWDVVDVHADFTAGAAVATRYPVLVLSRTFGPPGAAIAVPLGVTAGQVSAVSWHQGLSFGAPLVLAANQQGFARQAPLLAGETLIVSAINFMAGSPDSFSAPTISIVEWLDF